MCSSARSTKGEGGGGVGGGGDEVAGLARGDVGGDVEEEEEEEEVEDKGDNDDELGLAQTRVAMCGFLPPINVYSTLSSTTRPAFKGASSVRGSWASITNTKRPVSGLDGCFFSKQNKSKKSYLNVEI
jgi:hypothetical protein